MRYFTNLNQFYSSKEWSNLKKFIISQRINENGDIIDEYTGKPIYRKYDMVFHHKIELNLTNVNDPNISLNPDNIMIVSHKSHNEIHERFGFYQSKVILVHGNSCSGKTTFVKENKRIDDIVCDIDSIWQMISSNERYIKPNRLKEPVFDIKRALYEVIKTRRGSWFNAWVITTCPYVMERQRLIDKLGVDEVIHIDTPKDECLKRLYENPQGRNIEEWEKYINDYANKYQS